MQIARVNGTRLHWREDGNRSGRAVVFANSLGTDLRLWDDVIPLLPGNLRYIRYDKRGHGLSDVLPGPYTMDELVDDASALLDRLDIRECVFVGLSIGGMIGQALAARRPDLVRALVLSNTAAKIGEAAMWQDRIRAVQNQGIAAIADPVMERWFSAAFRTRPEMAAWRNMLTGTSVDGYTGCCHAIAGTDLTAATSRLTLPVLAIAGSEDRASPPELVRATADMIEGAKFSLIDGAGHLPCVEKPRIVADLLTAFLQELTYV